MSQDKHKIRFDYDHIENLNKSKSYQEAYDCLVKLLDFYNNHAELSDMGLMAVSGIIEKSRELLYSSELASYRVKQNIKAKDKFGILNWLSFSRRIRTGRR